MKQLTKPAFMNHALTLRVKLLVYLAIGFSVSTGLVLISVSNPNNAATPKTTTSHTDGNSAPKSTVSPATGKTPDSGNTSNAVQGPKNSAPNVVAPAVPIGNTPTAVAPPSAVLACSTTTPNTPGGPDAFGGCYPDSNNTGVPSGTVLTNYAGPMTITVDGTIIDSKIVTGQLSIEAKNVIISKTRINGRVTASPYWSDGSVAFTLVDSEVHYGNSAGTGIDATNFIVRRVEVTGGNRSIYCAYKCTVEDSYVHGQFTDNSGTYHESGIRVEAYSTLRHNSIACDAPTIPPDAGCSADVTGYPDFTVIEYNTIDKNLFMPSPEGAFCLYGGDTAGKAYSGLTHAITITNNVFQRGVTGGCALYGPFTDFGYQDPASIWSNNRMEDGEVLPSHW